MGNAIKTNVSIDDNIYKTLHNLNFCVYDALPFN
jgi:hypothetical protein